MPGVDIINPIQSARIRTINSFSFTYGTVEVRAKMPRGDWIWPGLLTRFPEIVLIQSQRCWHQWLIGLEVSGGTCESQAFAVVR